jgi:hypothetical protein
MKKITLVTVSIILVLNAHAPAADAVTRSEVAGLSPSSPVLMLGSEGTVYDPPNNPAAWYAMAEGYDTGTAESPARAVYAGYFTNHDAAGPSIPPMLVSRNGGGTFAATGLPAYEASARLDDGRVIHAVFTGQTSVNVQERTITMAYSADDGLTFPQTVTARLNIAPQTFLNGTANFYPNAMVQVPNGPLLMAGYAVLRDPAGNGVHFSLLMVSFNAGQSWTLRSTIGQGSTARGYNETGLVITSDGDLLAVMRSSNYDELWERRSTTFGTSWTSGPVGIPEFARGSNGVYPFGRINPRLSLLPNGILALVAGRPDNHIALSYDGTGNAWNVKKMYYDNHNANEPNDVNEGSSGNADFAWTGPNRAVLLADTCHAILNQGVPANKCTWHGNGGQMSGNTTQYQIKRVMADILTAGTGKIDLAGKVAAGRVRLGGDMNEGIAGHARTGARGAIDGSNEMWSSAVRSSGTGTFDITLDRVYTLSRLGLSLAIGATQSATVQTRLSSADPWVDWYTTAGMESYALQYPSVSARQASQVRVVTGAASACPPGVAAPCGILNEIELYASDVNSFENDPVPGLPRGYTASYTVDDNGVGHSGVWVSLSSAGSGTSRILHISDDHSSHLPGVFRTDSSSATKTLEFRFHPDQWRPVGTGAASGFLFDLLATPVNGARRTAFHFAVWYDGTIRYHAGGVWRTLGSGPALNPSTSCDPACIWSTIQVRATTTSATVTVNGVTIGSATRYDGTTSNLTGHSFTASSTADAQESFAVDDVYTAN